MEEIIKAMQAGEELAFNQIYQTYAAKLYRTAFLISRNKEDSEDILQETFIKCYLYRHDIKNANALEAWLMKIMIRTSWRIIKQRTAAISSEELLEKSESAKLAQRILTDQKNPEPLEQLLSQEQQEWIIGAIDQLDFKLRTVVILYYYENLSVKEIARLTNRLEGTIKSRLYTARTKLKKQLAKADLSVGGRKEVQNESALGKTDC